MQQIDLPSPVPPKASVLQGRDPAPSRTAYRLTRLWLTPFFRRMLRIGVPAAVLAVAGFALFGDATQREALMTEYRDIRRWVEQRPEFMVNLLAVDGASTVVAEQVRAILPDDFPVSSFDLDLEALRTEIEALDPVARAQVRVRSGGVLQVAVEERLPAVLWRGPEGLSVLDRTGHRVHLVTNRADQPDLPLIAGLDADGAVPEALALFAVVHPLDDRLRGLQRRGARRWDVVLDRDQVLQLPERNPVPALRSILALNAAQDLLTRDITHIDLRNPRRPTVRLAPEAVSELRRIRSIETERAVQ